MSMEPAMITWEFPHLTGEGAFTSTNGYPEEYEMYCQGWDQCPPYPRGESGWYQENNGPGDQCLRDKAKKAHRREKNRQASARYRERKQQLVDHLEAENRRMEEEIKDLESRLNRRLGELASLKAREGQPMYLSI